MELKPVEWMGTTRADIRAMRDTIKTELGHELEAVQAGLWPTNYKPMPTVGAGVYEIRVSDSDGIARLMYVAKFHDTVYVLHVFTKKTQKTASSDIATAKRRYKEVKHG